MIVLSRSRSSDGWVVVRGVDGADLKVPTWMLAAEAKVQLADQAHISLHAIEELLIVVGLSTQSLCVESNLSERSQQKGTIPTKDAHHAPTPTVSDRSAARSSRKSGPL